MVVQNKSLSHENPDIKSIQRNYNKLLQENNYLLIENNNYAKKLKEIKNNNRINSGKNPIIQKLNLKKNKERINNENDTNKNETSNENIKRIPKRFINYKKDYHFTEKNNESSEIKNPLRNYLSFVMDNTINTDSDNRNYKFKQKLVKKNNINVEDNNLSFSNSKKINKNREKEKTTIEKYI